jgi:pyridoxine 5-phosphate synthase
MPAKLSVNINKYALLRNSRGHNTPDLLIAADTVIAAGAHGVTVHPRLDQRHVRLDDLAPLAAHLAAHHPHYYGPSCLLRTTTVCAVVLSSRVLR